MQAFLSHSRKDEKIVNSIFKICQRAKIKPNIAEFEEIEKGKLGAKEICGMINRSQLFFLFLSENVVNDKDCAKTIYTQNWANFELGCAYAQKKEKQKLIYVFEPFKQLHFPIPYLDYYVLIDPNFDAHWDYLEELLSQEKDFEDTVSNIALYPFVRVMKTIDWLKGQRWERPSEIRGYKIHHKECGVKYTLLSKPEKWNCPRCRKPTDWMP